MVFSSSVGFTSNSNYKHRKMLVRPSTVSMDFSQTNVLSTAVSALLFKLPLHTTWSIESEELSVIFAGHRDHHFPECLASKVPAADLAEGLYRLVQFFRPRLVATEANVVSESATRRKDRAGHDTDILLQRLAVNAETIQLRG